MSPRLNREAGASVSPFWIQVSVLGKIPVNEGFQLQGCEIELRRKLHSALNHSLNREPSGEVAREW